MGLHVHPRSGKFDIRKILIKALAQMASRLCMTIPRRWPPDCNLARAAPILQAEPVRWSEHGSPPCFACHGCASDLYAELSRSCLQS
jgi:hypothetical protein